MSIGIAMKGVQNVPMVRMAGRDSGNVKILYSSKVPNILSALALNERSLL